ncbi:MAG: ABC transporter permease [Hungatella sp.]|nr:ABC transporter permease [Hungatella sp.]
MEIMSLINALPGAAAQGLIWGIMAIGVYLTYRILDIADLTVDGSVCTGGAVCIMMMLAGYNVWVSMAAALGAGMAAGLVTGLFHTFMGIPAILSGILTQLGLWSVNLKIMGKANQAINVDKFPLLVSLRFIKNVPFFKNTIFIVILITVILIGLLYWFFGTELGCSLRATGCNDKMARAQGINTDFGRVLGLMLSNGLVAFSGALLTQYQGFADINMGRGAIVIGLAAVIIGEAVFGKIFRNFGFKLLAVSFGSIIYYLVLQVVIWMGIDTDLLKLLSALVVAVFLAIPVWQERYFSGVGKKSGAGSGLHKKGGNS